MKNVTILNDLNTLNKLHTSSVESHTTNNGIVDFTCDNAGYVDNVAIEGKTLVNLWDVHNLKLGGQSSIVGNRYKCVTLASNRYSDFWTSYSMLKPNTTYTVIYNIIQNTLPTGVRAIAITRDHAKTAHAFNEIVEVNGGVTGIFTAKLTTKDSFTDVAYGLRSFVDNSTMGDGYIVELEIVLVEGDYTNTPIPYFEGLKSVGQGDNIEVLTRNQSNKNLFYGDVELGYIDNKTGINGDSVNGVRSVGYIKVDKNTTYTVSDDKGYNVSVNLYGENKSEYFGEIYGQTPYTFRTDDKTCWIRLRTFTGSKQNDTTIKWQLEKGNKSTEYAQPKYDKKEISTTLRSLPNGVKDTIEKRGNKYVKVQRCRELRLDGNSTFFTISEVSSSTKVYRVLLDVPLKDNKSGGKVFCDRFTSYANWELDEEECYVSINKTEGNAVCLKILKTRLGNTMTKEKLLAWLDANPTTIVYELATPIITELPNFNPQTYKGDNTLLINSGAIQCDASFDVCEGIRSELDVIKDKVSSLDDNIDNKSSAELVLLNGFKNALSSDVIKVFKNGNMCALQMSITNPSSVSNGTNIAKVPIGFIPKDYARVCGLCGSNTVQSIYNIDITPKGEIIIYKEYTANSLIRINVSWEVK